MLREYRSLENVDKNFEKRSKVPVSFLGRAALLRTQLSIDHQIIEPQEEKKSLFVCIGTTLRLS